ncbi:hypothetical protein J5681_02635 [bacterium]|nr:hypothetical protein [bacterium]
MVICKASEYDCDFQHQVSGIITVTKGSSRTHYILTEKGMKKAKIKDNEPIAYNPRTETALVKELTDSSIDIFSVDTSNGKMLSSEIVLKPERINKNGEPFLAFPNLLSSCIQNDGTIILLVNYENLLIDKTDSKYSEAALDSVDFLYVYEKGDSKKLKKYIFPQNKISDNEKNHDYSWEEPQTIQCTRGNIYLFSEKHYANDEAFYHASRPIWLLRKINLNPQKEEKNITPFALIAYDDIRFAHYFEKENAVYSITCSLEEATGQLRVLRLNKGYELPEEVIEKKDGEFLFSETSDGKPLIFFAKTRNSVEEQKLELLLF